MQVDQNKTQYQLKAFSGTFFVSEIPEFLVLGSGEACEQGQISGPNIEARHARVESRPEGYILKDLRTPAGTYVNEVRIQEAFLQDGDIIRLGDVEIVFEKVQESSQFPLSSKNEVWNQELRLLGNIAKKDFPVLLLGPSGTGKDVLANKLHEQSKRANGPFLSVNCSALTETLVESELFGHVKGSFTGAISDRKGAFEAARGGTLFLDEVGDLPYSMQSKLLRAIENSEIRPVGSDRPIKTDIRIIAATHQNLHEKIQNGTFRQDLFFRLNVISVTPPSLTNRMEDFDGLLYEFAKQYRVRFSFGATQALRHHDWPGNIRELKNVVCRASAYFPHKEITEIELAKILPKQDSYKSDVAPAAAAMSGTLPVIKEIERQMIIQRLVANKGNQRRTAKDLGMPKSTLHDRLRFYNIEASEYRP